MTDGLQRLELELEPPTPCQVVALSPVAFDALNGAIAFFDQRGALVIANRSMSSALLWPPVRQEVGRFKDLLIKQISVSPAPNEGELATTQFVHRGRLQHLRGTYLSQENFTPGPALCVTLHEGPHAMPTAEDLSRRFGLTRQEVQVALLLAEGLSNDEIAKALGVSPHTARHHTEHIFSKMAVASRSEVAWEVLHG